MKPRRHINDNPNESLSFSKNSTPALYILHRNRQHTFHPLQKTKISNSSKILRTPQSQKLSFSNENTSPQLFKPAILYQSSSHTHLPVLTPAENKEIQEKIHSKVTLELKKLKKKAFKRIEVMNKIGVVPQNANQLRGVSLLSVESSFIERKIPRLTRIAKTEMLSKKEKVFKDHSNLRSQVLEKMKSVLLKDFIKLSPFSRVDNFSIA